MKVFAFEEQMGVIRHLRERFGAQDWGLVDERLDTTVGGGDVVQGEGQRLVHAAVGSAHRSVRVPLFFCVCVFVSP